MKIIVCLDDDNGILFNKRRVSSDRVVIDKIIELSKGNNLWISEYSGKLFLKREGKIIIDNDFLNKAEENDYCFVENIDFIQHIHKVKEIIVYRWNRKYPSDTKLSKDIFNNFNLIETIDFEGNSHTNITQEIYSL